jgi:hypothetical protein
VDFIRLKMTGGRFWMVLDLLCVWGGGGSRGVYVQGVGMVRWVGLTWKD